MDREKQPDPAENKSREEMDFARFLAQIGHEIRTPLNAIKGFGELLVEEQVGELNPTQKKYLGKMTDSAEQLLLVVNHILDWAKMESRQITLETEILQLGQIAAEVGGLLELRLKEKNISYEIEKEPWAKTRGDWGRIREVMINLVGNAVKFTDPGGFVRVSFSRKDRYLITEVTDNGCGISKEKLPKIFQPFTKGTDRPGEEKNNGLGLWICRSIVELHQGKIWVESIEGEGTSFFFALPCVTDEDCCDPTRNLEG